MIQILHAKYLEAKYYLFYHYLLAKGLSTRHKSVHYPTIVQLQTLNRCNGSCPMCPYPDTLALRQQYEMPFHVYERIIAEIACWPVKGVLILGFQSEPFLDNRLEKQLQIARKYLEDRWKIEITTNGSLLSHNCIKRILASPPDILNISLNAWSEETYKSVMPGFSWNAIQDSLNILVNHKTISPRLYLRFIMQSANIQEYAIFKKRWNSRGVPVIAFECNDRLASVKNYHFLKLNSLPIFRRVLRKTIGSLLYRTCPLPFTQVNIQANGLLQMCCHDYYEKGIAGDIGKSGILALFNSGYYTTARKSLLLKQFNGYICDSCSFFTKKTWL